MRVSTRVKTTPSMRKTQSRVEEVNRDGHLDLDVSPDCRLSLPGYAGGVPTSIPEKPVPATPASPSIAEGLDLKIQGSTGFKNELAPNVA